jgi:predicted double-glycine peptidase
LIARATHFIATVAVLVTAAVYVRPAAAQDRGAPLHLLDVPYLPQSEALCGGAAVAMVMRFFGATSIYAETFSSLVDRDAGGIRGRDLLAALQERGWQAQSFRGDSSLVQAHLTAHRPVIALIQDRPGRFHYVVIVGWAGGRVIVHDPARAPYRILDEKQFTDAWAASDYWTLVAMPPADSMPRDRATSAVTRPESPAKETATPCAAMVDEGVRLSGAGDLEAARRLLQVAAAECPGSAAPWREMAGIHALKAEWREAARNARQALLYDATDPLASRILATSLYLDGDPDGALAAWNNVGEPLVDLVNVTGLERTRYQVVARAMALQPQRLLTPAALVAARRRLSELPAAQTTRVSYRPGENGRAQVDAVVLERPRFPIGTLPLAAAAVRMATDRELAAGIASPSGGGELWNASWRWWKNRPRVGAGFAAPAPFGGVWSLDGFVERQAYADGGAVVAESRRRAAFKVSDWTQSGTRWEVAAGVDSWRHGSRSFSFAVSGEQRLAADRLSLEAGVAAWGGGVRTWTTGLKADWRSAVRNEGSVWIARAGFDAAGANAPLALWNGAGTGQGRDSLLRAHPLLHDGIIRDAVFGRHLAHAGAEWRRWVQKRGTPLRLAPAVFIDAARARGVLGGGDSRAHFDAGAGLRVAVPGAGVVRVDLARGLRDGAMALSGGWTR